MIKKTLHKPLSKGFKEVNANIKSRWTVSFMEMLNTNIVSHVTEVKQ